MPVCLSNLYRYFTSYCLLVNFSATLSCTSKRPPPQVNRVADSMVRRQRTSLFSSTHGWLHWLVSAHARRFLSLPAGWPPPLSSVNRSSERLFNCCLSSRDGREWGGRERQTCTAGVDSSVQRGKEQTTDLDRSALAGACVLSACLLYTSPSPRD